MTIYNPHLLSRDDLVASFVARQPLLDELVDDVRRGGAQHHLLIGGRGAGKTTLLLRLAAAIEEDAALAKRCIPLRFPEEQYNISRLSDFWMNALDALIDALERRGERAGARRLEAELDPLEMLDHEDRARSARAMLEMWAQRARRVIVLLVDNLDLVLDRLSDAQWALREALSTENGLVLIGASSRFLDATIDYQSPFYDFFRVDELGPLDEAESRRLVLSLSQRSGTPQVAALLERDPARFKALHVLTGGTPRTLALLHAVLARDPEAGIERDLENLLDQLTPYYKARFDDLPAQSQVIVDKVALHWHPITAAECQSATGLDLNTVSAQLNRLIKAGVLAKVSLPEQSKLGFQLAERFFNIWYLMRASRRLRRRLAWFVEFLRIFYGEEDLERRAEALIHSAPADQVNDPAKLLAFASVVSDPALRIRLEARAVRLLVAEVHTRIGDMIDLEGEDIHLATVADRVRALAGVRDLINHSEVHWPDGLTSREVAYLVTSDPIHTIVEKRWISSSLRRGQPDRLRALQGYQLHRQLGASLLDAISNGECPAFAEVSTVNEMSQVFALAEHPDTAVIAMLCTNELQGRPLSDELLQVLLKQGNATSSLISVVGMLVGVVDWPRTSHLVRFACCHGTEPVKLDPLMFFLRGCVERGLAGEAIALMDEAHLSERWSPVHAALQAVHLGNSAWLQSLAPEMRETAEVLYGKLSDTTPDTVRDAIPRARRVVVRRVGKRPMRLPAKAAEAKPEAKPEPRGGARAKPGRTGGRK